MNKIIFLTFFLSQLFFSQETIIKYDTSIYQLDNKKHELKIMSLDNQNNGDLIMWLSKNEKEEYNSYFSKKGDFSLLDWLNDDNFSDYVSEIYSTFLKILKPKETFVVLYKDKPPIINYLLILERQYLV